MTNAALLLMYLEALAVINESNMPDTLKKQEQRALIERFVSDLNALLRSSGGNDA